MPRASEASRYAACCHALLLPRHAIGFAPTLLRALLHVAMPHAAIRVYAMLFDAARCRYYSVLPF